MLTSTNRTMKTPNAKTTITSLLAALIIGLITMAFSPKLGLDSYEIYLNDKLIMKQYINQPLNLRTLQLDKAAPEDLLWVKYNHCTIKSGSGSERVIVLKDAQGHELKQWTFANSPSENKPMKVSVAELRQLEKAHAEHQISMYYKSKELPGGELLAYLR
ncbi:hypothetical protein J0A67_17870 [Algoriphagus aestuariicola]|uniref:Uncharacterized protein n=1 Tax=Algoriphagus aestuariicola TaxID=1852016 RepID=A0ABS3BTW1_9BACT|nr:hypothetical protein [Algoriphagus aestuariicola]MBN7802750.1 hypothetical protein [Algoriphagus aestuariicola]